MKRVMFLYAVYAAGINVVCTPQFMGVPQTGTLFVNDIVYDIVYKVVK